MLPAGGFVCAAYSKQRLIICGSLQKNKRPLDKYIGGGGGGGKRIKKNPAACQGRANTVYFMEEPNK